MSVDLLPSSLLPSSSHFSSAQLARLDLTCIPTHIAIIPDGNRRWAKQHLSTVQEGHREGADTLMEIVKAAQELGIRQLTFYSFSTENWNRPPDEVMALMSLFASYLEEQCEEMVSNGIRLETIGHLAPLPSFLRTAIDRTKQATRYCHDITLILALNYGGRDEICRAFRALLHDYKRQQVTEDEINEATIARYLDTSPWGDPELFIRTSGELRVSNFLLWQISYAEIYVTPVLWPDFTPSCLLDALVDFQQRQRRWGGGGMEDDHSL